MKKKNRMAYAVYAGLNGHAMMMGQDDLKPYGWIDADQKWSPLGEEKVMGLAAGRGGRLYKIDYSSHKVF